MASCRALARKEGEKQGKISKLGKEETKGWREKIIVSKWGKRMKAWKEVERWNNSK